MKQIEIYSTRQCPYCVRARALLDTKGMEYTEIDVFDDHQNMQYMIKRSGQQRTLPQIFINGESVGGYEQLSTLALLGELG